MTMAVDSALHVPEDHVVLSTSAADALVLDIRNLDCGYDGIPVLRDVSLSVEAGEVLVMIGPNGVGKSTLFKTVLGLLPKLSGSVLVGGEDTEGWSRRRLAQAIAYVPQIHDATFGFSVREMVLMGRTPSTEGLMRTPTHDDELVVEEVMEQLGITRLADRDCRTLSGGELQMVLVARSLAQRPRLLMMDEPCANLDLGNQMVILRRILSLAADGLSVVITSHDPNHALQLEASVLCIGMDAQTLTGKAGEILTDELLGSLYGIEVGVGDITGSDGSCAKTCVPFVKQRGSE